MDPSSSSSHTDDAAFKGGDGDENNSSSSSPPSPVPVETAVVLRVHDRRGVVSPLAPHGEDIWDAPVTSATRSAAAVDYATGLPNDLDEIASPLSDHVQDEQLQKSLGDFLSIKDESSKHLDQARGASFMAGKGIFAEASCSSQRAPRNNKPIAAPTMPSYHTPSSTSYRTANSFAAVRTDVENVLAQCSVYFEQEASAPHLFECTAVRQGAQVAFEVTIFETTVASSSSSSSSGGGCNEHLVDVDRMSGCRYAFSEAAADLAQHLQFCSSGAFSAKRPMPSCPPAFSAPPLPPPMMTTTTTETTTTTTTTTETVRPPASSPATSTATAAAAPAAADDAAALCAKHLLSMLNGKTFSQKIQAVRAAGALAHQQYLLLLSTAAANDNNNNANNENNEQPTPQQQQPNVFADSRWMDVAEKVASLATNKGSALAVRHLEQSEELQVVAMAALANIVALESAESASSWSSSASSASSSSSTTSGFAAAASSFTVSPEVAADTVAAGVAEDNHHLRRESLRAAADLACLAGLAPQLVRRGVIPHLERAAAGYVEDGECEDPLMARFAESALVACRA